MGIESTVGGRSRSWIQGGKSLLGQVPAPVHVNCCKDIFVCVGNIVIMPRNIVITTKTYIAIVIMF